MSRMSPASQPGKHTLAGQKTKKNALSQVSQLSPSHYMPTRHACISAAPHLTFQPPCAALVPSCDMISLIYQGNSTSGGPLMSAAQAGSNSPGALTRRRGDYGFDAPYVPIMLGTIGLVFTVIGILALRGTSSFLALFCLIYGILMLLSSASYVYTTRVGKFRSWANILSQLGLRGDEQALDIGCGRGAILLMVASLLPHGKAVGVDLWKSSDQSGNALSATEHNAELEGVADRVELHTGDMRKLPFADNSFDLILSSLAIHNIPEEAGRDKAIDEAIRVVKPGGRIVIADFRNVRKYEQRLREKGMADVTYRTLDWRFWYGGPWTATKLVTARKP
jgi:arsenite methyltransferase